MERGSTSKGPKARTIVRYEARPSRFNGRDFWKVYAIRRNGTATSDGIGRPEVDAKQVAERLTAERVAILAGLYGVAS